MKKLANKLRRIAEMVIETTEDIRLPMEFNQQQLLKGVKIEMQFTDDILFARGIAMSHLIDNPRYYDLMMLPKEDDYQEQVSQFGHWCPERAKRTKHANVPFDLNEVKREMKNFYKYIEHLDNCTARLVNEHGIKDDEPILEEFDDIIDKLQIIKNKLKDKYLKPFEIKSSLRHF